MDGKLADIADYLHVAHNGGADINAFIASDYGNEYKKLLELGFGFEEDPTGPAVNAWYAKRGLNRHMFQNGDFYTRWLLIAPKEMETEAAKGAKYPVVFANHGGFVPVPTDEFQCGWPQVAAAERIIVVMAQNTNWENISRILDRLEELYPIDTERVYMTGESQGGYEVTSALFRMPERITAVTNCGNDIWRDYDNFNVTFSQAEINNLKATFVPFMEVVGQYEASCFAPVNDWGPRKDWGRHETHEHSYIDPRRDDASDPTHIVGGRRAFSDQPAPPTGVDKHEWMISRLNQRMDSLGCEPRDAEKCIGYLTAPVTGATGAIDATAELHKVVGFYGDTEQTQEFYGYKHWRVDIHNADGYDAFRLVVVQNSGHHWPVMAARLAWDFFKRFHRDGATGKIVENKETVETASDKENA
jgi:poly(3-hydroxybutyrate) depolymerase